MFLWKTPNDHKQYLNQKDNREKYERVQFFMGYPRYFC